MLAPTCMADGARTRSAGNLAVSGLGRWRLRLKSGRSVLRTRTRLMSIGTSSWRTVGSWRTTSLATTAQGQWIAAGIVSCGRCGRHMTLRYSGPDGDYPVYVCVADQISEGRPKCQEVRALAVDVAVERLIRQALTPDRIALAVAALDEIDKETSAMERQWSLKREHARYDAERARRQYDAVEPENRLVARSLERAWEERLRRAEQIEQEYAAWHREQAVSISDGDRQEILALGEDLPRLWNAVTATSADRKQIARLVIKEVTLDQKRRRGCIWIRIVWQTGSTSEHWFQRTVQGYAQYLIRISCGIASLN